MNYPIIEIRNYETLEQLGTKEKFWFYDDNTKITKLFKIGRPGTGENWAEKAAGELAKLLTIPCAKYDFALWNGKEGVATPIFVPEYGRLIHGNELLAAFNKNYPSAKMYKVREYQLFTVLNLLRKLTKTVSLPLGYVENDAINTASDMFIAYLMLDCWISNPDRHHENWGLVSDNINQKIHLAPTYDHASGLGCRVSDEERKNRLATKDKRYSVAAFVGKAQTSFYGKDQKSLKTIDAYAIASKLNKRASDYWIKKLKLLPIQSVENIFSKIPSHLISDAAIDFAYAILKENRKRLLKRQES